MEDISDKMLDLVVIGAGKPYHKLPGTLCTHRGLPSPVHAA